MMQCVKLSEDAAGHHQARNPLWLHCMERVAQHSRLFCSLLIGAPLPYSWPDVW